MTSSERVAVGDHEIHEPHESVPRGITGFSSISDRPPPETDSEAFRRDLFDVCVSVGANVLESSTAVPIGRSFFGFLIEIRGGRLHVLLNGTHSYVAFARSLDQPLTFVDHADLHAALSSHGTYRVLTRRELDRPLAKSMTKKLAEAEIEQLEYWKPKTLGQLIFNW